MSNIPKLRFPEFSGEWEKSELGKFTQEITRVNSDVLVFKIIKDNSKFINNIICSDLFLSHVMNGAKGTKMPRGDKNQMMDFIEKKTSFPEQQKIADYLSNVDSKITTETRILNTK